MKKNVIKILAIAAIVVSVLLMFSATIFFKVENFFVDLTLEKILLLVVSLVLVYSAFGKK